MSEPAQDTAEPCGCPGRYSFIGALLFYCDAFNIQIFIYKYLKCNKVLFLVNKLKEKKFHQNYFLGLFNRVFD